MNLDQNRYDIRLKSHHASRENYKYLIKGNKTLGKQLHEKYNKNKRDVIYVHIPFCSKICTFCNMRRSLITPPSSYSDLIVQQIKKYSEFQYIQDSKYDAIYFGGGTPTTLDTDDLQEILKAIKTYLPLTENAEITIETSITDLTKEKMDMFFEEGVNRFSIGIQTFSENGRKLLGRIGNKENAINKINTLKNIGFSNISLDIIYNYPNQSMLEAKEDIQTVMDLNLAGFSFYSLILNEKSVLRNKLENPSSYYRDNFEKEKTFFNIIVEKALSNEHEFLELTKIVRPGRDKYKYILRRYEGGDTLPLGAGAGGYIGNTMINNSLSIEKFKAELEDMPNKIGIEVNANYDLIHYLIGQVQMGKIDTNLLEKTLPHTKVDNFLKEMKEEGMVEKKDSEYVLTTKGLFWGNNISNELSNTIIEELYMKAI